MRARDNPFRTERLLQVRYRLQGITWAELLNRCAALRYRAALIGPRGSGKTTLLEDLAPRFHERGFRTRLVRLDEEQPTFGRETLANLGSQLTSEDILLFDGAEQMNTLAWSWFQWRTRRAGGLIITTHRGGRLPTLWECGTSPQLLAEIAADLLEVRSLALREESDALFHKHCGNVREALREMYDLAGAERGTFQGCCRS